MAVLLILISQAAVGGPLVPNQLGAFSAGRPAVSADSSDGPVLDGETFSGSSPLLNLGAIDVPDFSLLDTEIGAAESYQSRYRVDEPVRSDFSAPFAGTSAYYGALDGAPFATGIRTNAPPGLTLRGLLKLYANTVADRSPTRPANAPAGAENRRSRRQGPDSSGFTAILDLPVNEAVFGIISTILRPTISVEGLVSFSIIGLGNFAIMVTENRRELSVVDLKSGKQVRVKHDENSYQRDYDFDPLLDTASGTQKARPDTGAVSELRARIRKIVGYVYDTITDPLKMSFFFLLVIMWTLWRFAGRNA
ncbi:MAG: hypothetical protein ACE5H8_15025 [Alphaproteobacteria bacterium]